MNKLNHHAATVLPYYVDSENKLYLVLEQKDPNYKKPFFDNGLNFLGGNWKKGIQEDKSPEETLEREIQEEFWQKYEAPESLNDLLGEQFLEREPYVRANYDQASVNKLSSMSPLLLKGAKHVADYIVKVKEPIINLTFGSTVFCKELTEDELFEIKLLTRFFNGKLTTDNLKVGSKTRIVELNEINQKNIKFSWGNDHVVNNLLERKILPEQKSKIIRTLNLISLEEIKYLPQAERTETDNPTYKGFESLGFTYKEK